MNPVRWSALLPLLLLVPWNAPAQDVPAQDTPARDGLFLSVPTPIKSETIQQLRQKIDEALERKRRPMQVVVFDFNPQELPSFTSDFGVCVDLADFIRSLQQGYKKKYPPVTTIAFVHNEVAGHAVLPVLSCKQIIMSTTRDERHKSKARIGDILRGQDRDLKASEKLEYGSLAKSLGLGDLVERMIHKNVPIKKVKTTEGIRYVSPTTLEAWNKEGKQFQVQEELPGLEPGSSLIDADLAQRVGLCQERYNSRAEIASALRLPRSSLTEDVLVGRTPVVWRIELKGKIDKGTLDSFERRIRRAVGQRANLVILQLEAEGGEITHVASVANWLRTLVDENTQQPIKTVAYIPPGRSLGAATFLALGASEIIMGQGSALADFNYLKPQGREDEARPRTEDDFKQFRKMLTALAHDQGYPELLLAASLDEKLVLYRVKSLKDPNVEKLVSEAEMEKLTSSGKDWQARGRIDHPPGQFLRITAPLAGEWGIALATEIDSVEAVYNYYGLDSGRLKVARDDWLDRIAEFFREPAVNFLLIMLGIVGLLLELKMPGATIPGVMAAICFVLFFWAYSFVGEFTILAVLLFVLGVVLLGIEVFIIPGFGFTGVTGLLLLITSLVLVTLERMPETTQDWVNLGGTVGTFGLSITAAIVAVVVLAWYLPSIPYANRLVLKPPEEDSIEESTGFPAVPPSMLGAMGVASTPLRPAGKAQFGDDFFDVVAEGDFVNPGSRVQIIEIEGNRIVVKEV